MAQPKPDEESKTHVVSLAEVKALLEEEQGGRSDLSYEQKLALDHVSHFARLTPDKAKSLQAELVKVSPRVTEWYAAKIVDVMPTAADDVIAIFARERSPLDKGDVEKIIEVVRGYL
ncbi:MAG: RNA polymerase Rpb4 family protein [Thermoplasmatota archaeon]